MNQKTQPNLSADFPAAISLRPIKEGAVVYTGHNYEILKPKLVQKETYPDGHNLNKTVREIEIRFTGDATHIDADRYGRAVSKWKTENSKPGWSATKFNGPGQPNSIILTLIRLEDAKEFISDIVQSEIRFGKTQKVEQTAAAEGGGLVVIATNGSDPANDSAITETPQPIAAIA